MLDAIVILIAALIAWIWSSRGFFSAFLHMLCVIIAGALAFALWEPTSMLIMSFDESRTGYFTDAAWGLGLGLPFAIILAILRTACDKLVPANLDLDGIANIIGGAACGAVAGVISTGMVLLSVGYLRVETEFAGYRPIQFDNNGSLVRKSGLIVPVDTLTARFYSMLSTSTFLPFDTETLARWRPELQDEGPLLRTNFEGGKSRQSIARDGFELMGRYQFTSDKNPKDLTSDALDPNATVARQQSFTYVDGEAAQPASSLIEGFVLKFKAPAKETSGRVVIGPGQVRLVVQRDANDPASTMGIQPMAMISQASGDKPALGRWRFDASETYIASVGGASDAMMAFEFLVPKGSTPLALYVKGMRVDVSQMTPFAKFGSMAERDSAVTSGSILPAINMSKMDRTQAAQVKTTAQGFDQIFRTGAGIPFNVQLQKDNAKGLEFDDSNWITGGTLSKFSKKDIQGVGLEAKLSLRRFATTDDTQIVQVTMDKRNTSFGLLSDAAANTDRSKPVLLLDNNGAPYQAVGYVYRGNQETWIYFNPQSPLSSLSDQEMPTISRSQPDQELVLIFRVSKGVKITSVAIGDRVIAELAPPIEVK